MRRALLVLLFVLSGAAALCYEVAWTRHLVLVFGNTTRAVALLLGAYMLGLAAGSEVGGRLADRTRRPALWYAGFELAIAAYALAFPWLLDVVKGAAFALGTGAGPALFLLAFALLAVPTFCMGTTLPLLVRATVVDPAQTGRDVGRLYGANILGAVLGAGLTGFWLMEAAGVLGSTVWAAAVNAGIGVVGWMAFRRAPSPSSHATAAHAPTNVPAAASATDGSDRVRRAALLAAFTGGFVGLAAQVAWTRLLVFFLQGFTWTFTAILTTFLAGLALGGWVFGRAAARTRDPARLLGILQIAVGVAAAAVMAALTVHHDLTRTLWTWAGGIQSDLRDRHRIMLLAASAVIVLVPAFVMGGVFPVAAAVYQRGLGDLGARVGRLYAVNTVGCVAGSLVAGFVLQPLVGPAWAGAVVAALSLVAGVAALAVGGAKRWAVPAAAGAVFVALLLVRASPGTPFLLRAHAFAGQRAREFELETTRHGEVCTVSVVANTRERYRLLYTDEFEAAGTKPEYRYMRMLAHLPIALADDPSRTLVICFGTGTTPGSVAAHSAVRELDIVEISPEVLEVAPRFADVNRDVLRGAGRDDLAVRVHVDDGRHFVQRGDAKWGVVTLEPLMPYTPAAIHFYTEDFYRECGARLAPGGLMCQWIPLQGMSGEHFPRLVASFVRVFPESAMFFVDGAVALIGGNDGVRLSWRRVSERLADPRVAEDLRGIGFDDPARALATFVASGAALRTFGDVAPVTDEFPVLEFHPLPANVVLPWLGQNVLHVANLRASYERLPVDLTDADDADRANEALYLALRCGNHVLDGLVRVEAAGLLTRQGRTDEAVATLREAREAYARAVALDPANDTARRLHEGLEREWLTIQGSSAMDRNDFAGAERLLTRAVGFRAQRQADVAWTRLAEVRNRAESFEAALEAACEATRLFPGGLEARAERAFARAALGDLAGASADYARALRGAAPETLPARLREDARRVFDASPPEAPAAGPFDAKLHLVAPDDFDAAIADASAGRGPGRIPARLRLRLLASESPDRFVAAFAKDLAAPDAVTSDADALARIARLRLAAPDGAAGAVRAWIDAGRAPVAEPAAEALAELDRRAFAEALAAAAASSSAPGGGGPGAAPLARAAARCPDRRVVAPLLRLLNSGDAEVRRAAHRALFSLTGGDAPGIAALDPDRPDAAAYRGAVLGLAAWWAREQDTFELR